MTLTHYIKRRPRASIGGKKIIIKPLGLEEAVKLILIIAPYVPLLEEEWPKFKAALEDDSGGRPFLLSAILRSMASQMAETPGEIMEVVSLLTGEPVEWLAKNAKAEEIIKSFPVFDEVNNLGRLMGLIRGFGHGN